MCEKCVITSDIWIEIKYSCGTGMERWAICNVVIVTVV